MKNKIVFYFVFAAMALGSCTVMGTLYPLSENENDFVFKKEIIGNWGDPKDSSQVFVIDSLAGTKGKSYRLTLIDRPTYDKPVADTSYFIFNILMMRGFYFLDSRLDEEKMFSGVARDYSDLMAPRHFIYRVSIISPAELQLSYPNPDQLVKMIDEKKINLRYLKLRKDDYLIVNESKELKIALQKSLDHPSLYKDVIRLYKMK